MPETVSIADQNGTVSGRDLLAGAELIGAIMATSPKVRATLTTVLRSPTATVSEIAEETGIKPRTIKYFLSHEPGLSIRRSIRLIDMGSVSTAYSVALAKAHAPTLTEKLIAVGASLSPEAPPAAQGKALAAIDTILKVAGLYQTVPNVSVSFEQVILSGLESKQKRAEELWK